MILKVAIKGQFRPLCGPTKASGLHTTIFVHKNKKLGLEAEVSKDLYKRLRPIRLNGHYL